MKSKTLDVLRVQVLDAESRKPVFDRPLFLAVSGKRKSQVDSALAKEQYRERYDVEPYYRFAKKRLLIDKLQTPDAKHPDTWLRIVQITSWLFFTARQEIGQVCCSVWQKSLGGTNNDILKSIEPIAGGGYALAGHSSSQNGDVSGTNGTYDFWVVKLTAAGAIEWEKSLGGTRLDFVFDVGITSDGGYIVAGSSGSSDGDVIGHHSGDGIDDFWIVKLAASPVATHDTLAATPAAHYLPKPNNRPPKHQHEGREQNALWLYHSPGARSGIFSKNRSFFQKGVRRTLS